MYSRIRYDIFFKKVFQHEHILKAFLNTVLEHELSAPITSLTYQPTEFIGHAERQALNVMKHIMFDVFVTTQDGSRALIEIQKGSDKTDLLRFIDYHCRNFSHQFRVGDDYTQVVPCYSVCWLFDMTPPHHDYHEIITLTSNKKHTDWHVNWELVAIYPRCITPSHLKKKQLDALEEWLLLDVVTDIKKAKEIKSLIHSQVVQEAFEQLDISGLTDEEIEELEFQEAITERYKVSYTKCIQESQQEKAIDIARKMLKNGMDIHVIHELTGIEKSDIEHLIQE